MIPFHINKENNLARKMQSSPHSVEPDDNVYGPNLGALEIELATFPKLFPLPFSNGRAIARPNVFLPTALRPSAGFKV